MTTQLLLILTLFSSVSCVFYGAGSIYFTYLNKYGNSGLRIVYRPQNYLQYSNAGRGSVARIGYRGEASQTVVAQNYVQSVLGRKSQWEVMAWNSQGKYYYLDTALVNVVPGYWVGYGVSITDGYSREIYLDINRASYIPFTVTYCELDSSSGCGCRYPLCSSVLPRLSGPGTSPPPRNSSYWRTTRSWQPRNSPGYWRTTTSWGRNTARGNERGRYTTPSYEGFSGYDKGSVTTSASSPNNGGTIAGVACPILLLIVVIIIVAVCVKKGRCRKPPPAVPVMQFNNRQTPAPAQPPPAANPVPLNNISQSINIQYPPPYPQQSHSQQPPPYRTLASDSSQQPQAGFTQVPPLVPSAPPAMPSLQSMQPPEYQLSSSNQYPHFSTPKNQPVNISQKIGNIDYNNSSGADRKF